MKKKLIWSLLGTLCICSVTGCGIAPITSAEPAPTLIVHTGEISDDVRETMGDDLNDIEGVSDDTTSGAAPTEDNSQIVAGDAADQVEIAPVGDEYSYVSRAGQYGIQSANPELYNYYFGEFLVSNETKGIHYAVDFSYNIDAGVGSGRITVEKYTDASPTVYSVDEEFSLLLDKDNNVLAYIVDSVCEKDYEKLMDVLYNYMDTKNSSEIQLNQVTIEDIEWRYTAEGLAARPVLCVD